ncbi:aldehyde oxidase GLOX-like [Cocos nucifera]|uniref:Aldehyde oxidase GLOX-like n=1 Tax=Cocos nucifera TaxID=13894 RepID=A0A8K0ND03_COCNU|nr:aldehyde oxidase GLOX-like [Cocos nucifera]
MENPIPTPTQRRTTRTRNATATFLLALVLFLVERVVAPPGGGGGEWQLLHASIGISAMHMQLLPSDKVVMFDRTDFGPSNISLPDGRCRSDPADLAIPLDCTAHSVLLDLPSNALRPLTILSDTWCSSGALLPNGSLLQSGGFNDGDHSIRFFDSISGDPAADWQELPSYLTVRRWYASDQLLPDGRVLIVGGRRQFSYEFFPRQESAGGGGALIPFPFLEETRDGDSENNLYPFLHLLPDGTLFVFANTRAVILDVAGHQVLHRLPPIPDDVPRNYPSSGSSVLLPLRLTPGGTALPRPEVLICGGAPRGSYESALRRVFLPAATTCGRIGPVDPDPAWNVETMPIPRVMGDMVLLPTGDVLIVNGAAAGTAGWELAREPVMNPVLYSPGASAELRFTVLNGSNIPRLYHSTALLDPYGRVLVGGSNPHVGYSFTNVTYPTELSLEAFHPPYLAVARPWVVAVGAAAVGYGEVVAVRFESSVGWAGAGSVEVVAMAPAFATHAVGMNQRAVVLPVGRVTQVGPFAYEAEAAAPPSPEVAPPGYYLWFVVHAGLPSQGVWVRIRPAP